MQFYEISFNFFTCFLFIYWKALRATHRLSVDGGRDAWWLPCRRTNATTWSLATLDRINWIDYANLRNDSLADISALLNIIIILFPFNLKSLCKITNLWYIDFDTHCRWKSDFLLPFLTFRSACGFQIMTLIIRLILLKCFKCFKLDQFFFWLIKLQMLQRCWNVKQGN